MAPLSPMASHKDGAEPSPWVLRWAPHVAAGGAVLDVACGSGRHARYFAARGHPVDAVDRDAAAIATLGAVPGISARRADIENGPWPYAGRRYAAVVVTRYLHRPLMPKLIAAVAPGGLFIYETFAAGNEVYGRPSNPDFLLQPDELLTWARGMTILGFEELTVDVPKPAVLQRICAQASA